MRGLFPGLLVSSLVATAAILTGLPGPAAGVAAVAALCAIWWTTQPIPIAATSLLPFAVLPVLGVLDRQAMAGSFGHPLILLLLGGFLLSTVMERSGAHRRIALGVVAGFRATRGSRALAAFMVASAGLSMWISNTATSLMLLPVALAVIGQSSAPEKLGPPLLLGLAWSANIGGMGTPVGTPPNPLLLAELERLGQSWGFVDFMALGVPVVLLLLPLTWLVLSPGLASIEVEAVDPGPWRAPEIRALLLFGVTVVLWVSRTAPFGGWSGALGLDQVGDHVVALGMVVVAFVVPDGRGERLLDWETAVRIPWHLLLLFSGGLALGAGFRASGLDDALAQGFVGLSALPGPVALGVIAVVVSSVTELVSNTATAALLLPVLSDAALDAGQPAAPWLSAATLAASCAFMMPVATAPNAIVFGTGRVPAIEMVRKGVVLNLAAALVIAAVCAVGS